jgi:hypothetical protein
MVSSVLPGVIIGALAGVLVLALVTRRMSGAA